MKREPPTSKRPWWHFGLPAVGLAAMLGLWLQSCRTPPQMGPDEDVFRTVDALFTAVTARDERLLGECERRLHACRDAGKLPEQAQQHLDGTIAAARSGAWQSAAERLYTFMSAQRREG